MRADAGRVHARAGAFARARRCSRSNRPGEKMRSRLVDHQTVPSARQASGLDSIEFVVSGPVFRSPTTRVLCPVWESRETELGREVTMARLMSIAAAAALVLSAAFAA